MNVPLKEKPDELDVLGEIIHPADAIISPRGFLPAKTLDILLLQK